MGLISTRTENDQFLEDPSYDEPECKRRSEERRDFMVWYHTTEAKWLAFMMVQNRSLRRVKCQNPPYGLLGALTCNENRCRMSGDCLEYHSVLNLQNCSRYITIHIYYQEK